MPDSGIPKCRNCRFWFAFDEGIGSCRRYPPVIAADDDRNKNSEWPVTFRSEWCGEHDLVVEELEP